MSRENVQVVLAAIDAFNRADLEDAAERFSPDIAWHDQRELPGARVHQGRVAVLEHLRSAMADIADYRVEVKATREAGDDVLVRGIISGRGRTSGAAVERETFTVNSIEGGSITRVAIYGSEKEALEAVGLRE